jgi:hypothetical protein
MVAYNFQERFAADVQQGIKVQTIRAERKNGHAKPGDRVQLYAGMRTSKCRKLVDPDPVCIAAVPVVVDEVGISLGGEQFDWSEVEVLAKADGFENCVQMAEWFRSNHDMPMTGVLIKWEIANDSNS